MQQYYTSVKKKTSNYLRVASFLMNILWPMINKCFMGFKAVEFPILGCCLREVCVMPWICNLIWKLIKNHITLVLPWGNAAVWVQLESSVNNSIGAYLNFLVIAGYLTITIYYIIHKEYSHSTLLQPQWFSNSDSLQIKKYIYIYKRTDAYGFVVMDTVIVC